MAARSLYRIPRTVYLLSSIRKLRRDKPFHFSSRIVPAPVFCMVTKGKGTVTANGTVYRVEPFQLLYFAPGTFIEADTQTKETEYYLVIVDAVTAAGREVSRNTANNTCLLPGLASGRVPIRNTKPALRRLEELYRLTSSRNHMEFESADLQLQAFIDYVRKEVEEGKANEPVDNGIDSCIAYMHQHFHEKITRETMAEIARLTPNAFCRSFKRATGASPTDYLNRIRIDQAKERLTPSGSIKDVAVAVGFGSEYYFSRMFKETVGLSPSLFIKRERLKVATASRAGFHDNLASMGAHTAAAVDCYRYPWMDEAEYIRRLSSQLEQLRLVKPDLIIGDYFHQPLYETLKQIAPTVILDHHLDWRVTHMRIAELVGREKEASQTFLQLDERTSEARELLERLIGDESITVMQVIQHVIRIQGAVNHPLNELLYTGLGLKPGNAVPPNKMRDEWQPEEFPSIQSDRLFIITLGSQPQAETLLSRLQLTRNWETINAVANHKTHYIPNWLLMSWTPQGRSRILKEITDAAAGGI